MTANFNPETDPSDTASWLGIEDAAGLLALRLGGWNEFGYVNPPAPNCKSIPPLGQTQRRRDPVGARCGRGDRRDHG